MGPTSPACRSALGARLLLGPLDETGVLRGRDLGLGRRELPEDVGRILNRQLRRPDGMRPF